MNQKIDKISKVQNVVYNNVNFIVWLVFRGDEKIEDILCKNSKSYNKN